LTFAIDTSTPNAPTIGITYGAKSWAPDTLPALLARSWAQGYPEMSGLLIMLTQRTFPKRHTTVWFRSHFVFHRGQASQLRYSNERSQTANGICPHCGTIVTKSDLRRVLGPHPQAGQIILPSATAGACVAAYGATFACKACVREHPDWRLLTNWDSEVLTAPWLESRIPGSKLKPVLCALPGKFAWYRDMPYYVEINLKDGTIDVRKEFTA